MELETNMNKDKKFKNPYKNKYIAIIKKPICIDSDFCGMFQEYHELNVLRCGLYTIDITKDDMYNTLYVTYKPIKNKKYLFRNINYNIFEFNNKPTTKVIDIDPNKIFDYKELFKAQGFVDFINKCLGFKENVESDPFTFYIIYNNIKFTFKEGKWYKDNEEICEFDLLEFFYKIPWEYNSDQIRLKKHNIFKRLKNLYFSYE